MPVLARIILILSIVFITFLCPAKSISKSSFQVVAYNVENLFDLDGISLYDDYKPVMYGPSELESKLEVITDTLKKIGGITGPEIILFQEIEVDRTPEKILSATDELLRELKLKGMGPYYHKLGYNPKDSPKDWPAVHCLTLSKFPITHSRLHSIERARPILETTINVKGKDFTIFNNHWKSGASSPEMELHRIQNAQVLRNRIDQLIKENPTIDFLIGGDLNSHYNQSTIHREMMTETGINDRLLSSGIEPEGKLLKQSLYNLWHELPVKQRGSDAWKGKWGTLMHIIIPQTLYDSYGIGYVKDSFQVENHIGLNEIEGMGIPFKWSNDLNGFGSSDHFPITARFQVAKSQTQKGNNFPEVESEPRPVNYKQAKKSAKKWNISELNAGNYGKTFSFKGRIENKKPLKIRINNLLMGLYSFDSKTKLDLFAHTKGDLFSGFGYLARYRGEWQFIIAQSDWIN